MGIRRYTQTTFTQGEVGSFIKGRAELGIYRAGLETCENMILLPQGGVDRRRGFEFISANLDTSTLSDGSTDVVTGSFHTQSRLIPFKFGEGQEYVLIVEPADSSISSTAKIHVYYNDSRVAVITDGVDGNSFSITTDNIADIRFAQTFDVMIMVEQSMPPIQLVRGTAHDDWAVSDLSFDFYPLVNFNFATTLTPSANTGTGINLTLSSGNYTWVDASFPNGHIGMKVRLNAGLATITSVTNDTVAVADVDEDLADTVAATGNEWEITAFSNFDATKGGGYPRSVTFHQNRLIFGGSRDKPQTIFASQSGDFFNFKPTTRVVSGTDTTGEVTDDAGFVFTIASDELNLINHIISQQALFIFTTDGEFDMSGEPVTPSNVLIRQQTRYGIKSGNAEPKVVDNETMFIDKSGKQLRAFVYNFNTDAFSAKNYSLVHHTMLSSATQIEYLKNYKDTNTNYVVAVNNGDLCVMGVNVERDVIGWSRWTTNGTFLQVCEVDDSLYALVTRTNGTFLEKLTDEDVYLDCHISTSSTGSSYTGADGLQSQTVAAIADGTVHADITVDAKGNFTLTRVSSSTQIGYNYTSTVKTLPITFQLGNSLVSGEKIRKMFAELQFFKSKSAKVDGRTVPFRNFGSSLLDSPIPEFTGIKRMRLTGIGTQPQVTITVDEPLPMTLLSLTTECKFSTGKFQQG
ncbi:hypothetical protein [Candidatus Pelagibacter sp.]|uniref:hypothetical protein n=1 Tax=Candidatus Pelagibacter sp. TaxID=2024849 RepID=UPI003F857EB0